MGWWALKSEILEALGECVARPEEPLAFWIYPYHFNPKTDTKTNQFICMLKPELCRIQDGVNIQGVLELIENRFYLWGVQIRAIRVFSAKYLEKHDLIKKQYSVLNKVSKYGLEACPDIVRKRLYQMFPQIKDNICKVEGSFQVLKRYPSLSPLALEVLSQNVKTVKLGSGVYAISLKIDGTDYVVLNPFYPCQLDWFTKEGNAVVVFECLSSRDLKDIRQKLVGDINPYLAAQESLRHLLLKYNKEFNLSNVSIRFNGIHISPGPVEGLFGIIRYFSDVHQDKLVHIQDTSFGNLLMQNGMDKDQITKMEINPILSVGESNVPLFELTEEMNWTDAIKIMHNCFLN